VKEWYGWHFPELVRVVSDNILYARVVKLLGLRRNIDNTDLTDIMDEQTAVSVKTLALRSMGTDMSIDDMTHVQDLAEQVIEIYNYREELNEYIRNRMHAIAPNLTILVGELVGARLIAHAGSLINLAKHPASTVQILGAEKALFRALKTKKATPKYGLIYHASLVGQTSTKNRGKVSRILANKAVLSCRVDALGDQDTRNIGIENLNKIHSRMQALDGKRPIGAPSTYLKRYENENQDKGYSIAKDIELNNRMDIEEVPNKIEKKDKKKKDKNDKEKKDKEKKDKKDKKRKRTSTGEESKREKKKHKKQ